MTVNRICGSGIQSAILATQSLWLGDRKIIAAGGAESLSRAPILFARKFPLSTLSYG